MRKDEMIRKLFLKLVKLGIGHTERVVYTEIANWTELKELAEKHGLSAIVVDGLDKANTNLTNRPPQSLMLEWIGEVMQDYEVRYKQYEKAIGGVAGFYARHDIKMMVLKGFACSLDWPKPEHRPCGDIDIWQFGKQKEADALISSEKGIKLDTSHHHHTVFNWGDFTVENHYDFINIHRYSSNRQFESILKELGKDDAYWIEVNGERVYLPSPNLHALFLLRHSMMDFVASSLSMRQILDWAFFIEKQTKKIDWDWILEVLQEFQMIDFFNILNAICVEEFGFKNSIFPFVQFKPELKEKVLDDIFDPPFSREEPISIMPRLLYKYKRWQGNAWKQSLCFKESRLENFWSGIGAKLLKPHN